MTIAVDLGRKATKQNKISVLFTFGYELANFCQDLLNVQYLLKSWTNSRHTLILMMGGGGGASFLSKKNSV